MWRLREDLYPPEAEWEGLLGEAVEVVDCQGEREEGPSEDHFGAIGIGYGSKSTGMIRHYATRGNGSLPPRDMRAPVEMVTRRLKSHGGSLHGLIQILHTPQR